MVRGRKITVSDVMKAEVSGLPAEGAVWFDKQVMMHDAMDIFRDKGQELINKGKGIQPSSLGEPWGELERIFQNYITCNGH